MGHDSRIGANAVLVRSVADNSVVVGVPGQVISRSRKRTPSDRPDLDHTNAPDPMGTTVHELLDRVAALEERLAAGPGERTEPITRREPSADAVRMLDVGLWQTEDYSI